MSGGSKNFLSPDIASAAGLRPLTPATGGIKPPDTGGSPNSLQPTGSATGNPRNKVALRPGFSLMDWIKLTKSGKDLAGTGGRLIPVTPSELRKHNKRSDAWMALNGKVYNVTSYMEYHPGGWDELVRGAGKDATKLFNETHAWVNYESMLAACLVGKLVRDTKPTAGPSSGNSLKPPPPPVQMAVKPSEPAHMIRPTHDFHQTTDAVVVSVYTKRKDPEFASFVSPDNVVVDVQSKPETSGVGKSSWLQILVYSPYHATHVQGSSQEDNSGQEGGFRFYQVCYKLHAQVREDLAPTVSTTARASGKVEVKLLKATPGERWPNLGVGLPGNDMHGDSVTELRQKLLTFPEFRKWKLASKSRLTHDTMLYTFDPPRLSMALGVPIGHHLTLRPAAADSDTSGQDSSRSLLQKPYTPVSRSWDPLSQTSSSSNQLHFAIKTYSDGALTPHIEGLEVGESLEISNPVGKFRLSSIDGAQVLVLLAAGTGITPMVRLLRHFVTRKTSSPSDRVHLVYFNKTERDIIYKSELEALVSSAPMCDVLRVHHVLSQEERSGYEHGRVNSDLLKRILAEHLAPEQGKFSCVCGPIPFNNQAKQSLQDIGFKASEIFLFQG